MELELLCAGVIMEPVESGPSLYLEQAILQGLRSVDPEQTVVQGLLLLAFALAWAIHRSQPFAGWTAARARWHRARLVTLRRG